MRSWAGWARWTGWMVVAALAHAGGAASEGRPQGQPAPEIRSDTWLNGRPLKAADLAGQVRLVEFWTFGCINCVRTVPAMRELHRRFAGRGVVMVGVHTPEFERESDPVRVQEAVERLGIEYRVAMDNDHAVWKAFRNRYWPALYVVDKRGVIRHTHIGELHQGSKAWSALLDLIDRLQHEPD